MRFVCVRACVRASLSVCVCVCLHTCSHVNPIAAHSARRRAAVEQEAQIQTLQLERAASHSIEERFRDMQSQRDAAEAERSQLQEELAAVNARHAG